LPASAGGTLKEVIDGIRLGDAQPAAANPRPLYVRDGEWG
jgi:hypothetical protein